MLRLLNAVALDTRFAVRQLRRFPGLAMVAIVSLALGIGANTALFQLANRALFRPLSVSEPERLVSVVDGDAASARWFENSYREYSAYRDQNRVFSGVAASSERGVGLNDGDITRFVTLSTVSRNFFSVLGVRPSLGRAFAGPDVPRGSDDAELVLSYGLWQREFGADPSIVGRSLRVNGAPFTVIGIGPKNFTGIDLGQVGLWAPLHALRFVVTNPEAAAEPLSVVNDNNRWLRVTARLRPDASPSQALSDVVTIRAGIPYAKEQLPADGRMVTAVVSTVSSVALLKSDAGNFVVLLVGVVGFTLLIACANLATLLLATGTARAQELSVRIALGAGRRRLVRQLVTESTILALIGGAAGILVASWTGDLLRSFRSTGGLQFNAIVPEADLSTVLIALALGLTTSLLIGLAPAIAVTGRDPAAALGARHRLETPGQSRMRSWLMAAQIALALVLLTGAGLFGRSLRNALGLDLGFNTDRLAMVGFHLGQQRYNADRARAFYALALDRARAAPGIAQVALASRIPVNAAGARASFYIERAAGPENFGEHSFNVVTPGYFRTLEIPIVAGRDFDDRDAVGAPGAVIVNEALAQRAWPGENPIGKRFWFGPPTEPPLHVVGVARNSKYRSLRESGLPYYYLPLAQQFDMSGLSAMRLVLRGTQSSEQSLAAIRGVLRSIDPALPLFQAESAVSQLAAQLAPQQVGTTILGLLSVIGLVLALSGIYGVVSYTVARRTREIGVRIALGAQRGDVLRLTIGQGLRPVVIGAGVGIGLVVALGGMARSFMYGITPGDPVTIGTAAAGLLAACVAAMALPSVRATRIAPTQALREE